ncbi:MAG TPA: hypothetical protein VHR45_25865 [Thermoanaerobaculia bacterium]|nr:hypothetical protein [Thermoanaerobaculia bacterium]
MRIFIWLLVFVAGFAFHSQAPVGERAPEQPACEPKASHLAPWKMSQLNSELKIFYARAAASRDVSLDVILGPLADNYYHRKFAFSDFEGALASLKLVIERRDSLFTPASHDDSEPAMPAVNDKDLLFVYLDPTCETCQGVLNLLTEARASCSASFPAIVLRPLPSAEKSSLDASVVLRMIEKRSPASFVEAFSEFLNLLPSDAGRLVQLSSAYLGDESRRLSRESTRARRKLIEERQALRSRGYFPPIVSYRGRTLRRSHASSVPFDPLRDQQALLQTMYLIRSLVPAPGESMVTAKRVK